MPPKAVRKEDNPIANARDEKRKRKKERERERVEIGKRAKGAGGTPGRKNGNENKEK